MANTVLTGTGAGSNPYFTQWSIDTDATLAHGVDLSNLTSQAGGNTATPTTATQALKITAVQTAGSAADFITFGAITTTTVVIDVTNASGSAAWRVTFERAQPAGY